MGVETQFSGNIYMIVNEKRDRAQVGIRNRCHRLYCVPECLGPLADLGLGGVFISQLHQGHTTGNGLGDDGGHSIRVGSGIGDEVKVPNWFAHVLLLLDCDKLGDAFRGELIERIDPGDGEGSGGRCLLGGDHAGSTTMGVSRHYRIMQVE